MRAVRSMEAFRREMAKRGVYKRNTPTRANRQRAQWISKDTGKPIVVKSIESTADVDYVVFEDLGCERRLTVAKFKAAHYRS